MISVSENVIAFMLLKICYCFYDTASVLLVLCL